LGVDKFDTNQPGVYPFGLYPKNMYI